MLLIPFRPPKPENEMQDAAVLVLDPRGKTVAAPPGCGLRRLKSSEQHG
jgi:hypothetical protein